MISDRYRVDELIAKGGMGTVYRGYHRYLKKRVAVKVIQPDMDGLPDLVTRFEREAIAGAHVAHPNVAAATDFGKLDDGSYFLVVEHVRGETLSDVIKRGRLPAQRAARIARQLASALHTVHAMGIIHRDVKPRNVMIVDGTSDTAKLIDFGLARVPVERLAHQGTRRSRLDSAPQRRITAVGEVFGTVAYLAPESAMGMDLVDGRADLYALGILFYEMLAGFRPFISVDPGELFLEQHEGAQPFARRAPDVMVPPELEAVVLRLLAHDPAVRYQTGAEVVDAIDSAMGTSIAPPTSTGATVLSTLQPELAPPVVPSRARLFSALAALAVAVVAVVVALQMRVTPPPSEPRPAAIAPPPPVVVEAAPAVAISADPTLRHELFRASRSRDLRAAWRTLGALVERDPGALREPDVATAARNVILTYAPERSNEDLLDALSRRGGSGGLDLIYAIVERRGGSLAAVRATEILRRPEIMETASRELQIAFAVRDAPCSDKLHLLDRAVREGDARTLTALETQGRACFPRFQPLEAAILQLKARLVKR
ncbi:serine/threonine protein kinase [Minicystis rosea]|nr:serine/threonine protein kinase [Minicystis rosea]